MYISLARSLKTVRKSRPAPKVDHPLHVLRELLERHTLLVQVHADGTAADPAHQREVTAVPAHRLDYELRAGRGARVADAVDGLYHEAERGVRTHRHLRARDAVVDGGRQHDRRDLEGGVALSLGEHRGRRRERVPSADEEQAVDAVSFQAPPGSA